MIYRFPPFELDTTLYELRRDGAAIPVQRKVFDVLLHLVEHADRVVGKEELLVAVWPAEVIGDSAVHRSVCSARRVLTQQGRPSPIETIHGRGYRFRDAVTAVGASVVTADPLPRSAPTQPLVSGRGLAAAEVADPFVGREDVLDRLRRELPSPGRRHGAMFLLTGERGIGKTRCAEILAQEARARRISVWYARCSEVEGAPELWPWVQIVRGIAAELLEGDSLQVEALSLLESLAPTRPAPRRAEDPLGPDASERFRLLDATCRFLRRAANAVASGSGALLWLDDLSRGDATSLALLDLLGADLDRVPLQVIATVRDVPAGFDLRSDGRSGPGASVLPSCMQRIALQGLGQADVDRYVRRVSGIEPAPALVKQVHRKTGGNPLFMRELLRLWMATRGSEGLRDAALDEGLLPAAVHEVIGLRLRELPERTREVLDGAAVLGETFALSPLAGALGVAPPDLLALLDAAIEAGLLRRDPAPAAYRFTHGLIRDALYEALPSMRAMRLHLGVARALDGHAVDAAGLGEVAFHYYRALPDGPAHKAWRAAVDAARAAGRSAAHADAARLLSWALRAETFEPQPDSRRRLSLLLGAAACEHVTGNSLAMRAHVTELVDLASRHARPDVLALGGILLRPMAVTCVSEPDALARRALEQANAQLPPEAGTLRSRVLSRLSGIPPYASDREKRIEMSERASELASPSDPRSVFDALTARHLARSAPEDLAEAQQLLQEMLRLVQAERPTTIRVLRAHFYAYRMHLRTGEPDRAARALRMVETIARERQLADVIWLHDRLDLQSSFCDAELAKFESGLQELRERGQRLCIRSARRHVRDLEALLARERCEPPAPAMASLQRDPGTLARRAAQVREDAESGALEQARSELLRLGRSRFGDLPRDGQLLATLAQLALAAVLLEDRRSAESLLAQLLPYGDQIAIDESLFSWGSVWHYLGLLSRLLGQRDHAREYLVRAVERNERLGHRTELARSRLALGDLLAQDPSTDLRKRGLEQLRSVHDEARALGLVRTLRDSERALLQAASLGSRGTT